jgi:hypothetical protein
VDEGLAYTVRYFRAELGLPQPAEGAREKEGADRWGRVDAAPLWTATLVNGGLTDAEKGWVLEEGVGITPGPPE